MSDHHILVVEKGDADESSDMAIAMQVGDALSKHYPLHPWIVSVQGRGLVIRHMAIAAEVAAKVHKEGFATLLPRDKLGTPKEITRTAVRFGGELLEAFQLPRGKWDGRDPICPPGWGRATPFKHKGFQ
jgi:hypothetical protein